MARTPHRRQLPERPAPTEKPVSSALFWVSMVLTGLCSAFVIAMVIWDIPHDILGPWSRVLIVGLLGLFVIASLATTEIIPWRARSWSQWRRPKVLGALVYLILGAIGFVSGIASIFSEPAAKQSTVEATHKTVESTQTKIDDLTRILRKQFPSDPSVLKDIVGKWGDLNPPCEVIWDIGIIRRGDKAALVAQTAKVPDGADEYTFVGEIITAENGLIRVEGVEPTEAQGNSARFELNAATQRLSWDDRARGSGGVEVYRRCP